MPCEKCELVEDIPLITVGETQDLGNAPSNIAPTNPDPTLHPPCPPHPPSSPSPPAPPPADYPFIHGDVNGNEIVNILDVIILVESILGVTELPESAPSVLVTPPATELSPSQMSPLSSDPRF